MYKKIMIKYIKSQDYKEGAEALAKTVIKFLNDGKRVLWILTGGSSIPACVEALNYVKQDYSLNNLTVTLTDERYGPVGHTDSSWQKLIDSGFVFDGFHSIPVLTGVSFEETAKQFEESINTAFHNNDVIISTFGIGCDLHIAGILPNRSAVSDSELVLAYHTPIFNRITLTFNAIKKVNIAYVFIFGESKKNVVTELQNKDDALYIKPANIIKSIQEVYIYSDQIL